jgi:hypothetical protein
MTQQQNEAFILWTHQFSIDGSYPVHGFQAELEPLHLFGRHRI